MIKAHPIIYLVSQKMLEHTPNLFQCTAQKFTVNELTCRSHWSVTKKKHHHIQYYKVLCRIFGKIFLVKSVWNVSINVNDKYSPHCSLKANLVLLFELTYFVKPCLAVFGMWIFCYCSRTMAQSLKTHCGTWSWFLTWHLFCSSFHLISSDFGMQLHYPHTFFSDWYRYFLIALWLLEHSFSDW